MSLLSFFIGGSPFPPPIEQDPYRTHISNTGRTTQRRSHRPPVVLTAPVTGGLSMLHDDVQTSSDLTCVRFASLTGYER
jgi:hypothetical protein